MPILVITLALIIAGGSYVYFITPAPETTPETTEMNRSPETEQSEEREVTDSDQSPDSDTSTDTEPSTYTASANYMTPARTEHDIAVTLTLDSDGVVTDADVVYDDSTGYSNANQERFDNAYKNEVVGVPLENISLSRVGGASLTSGAFNEAVEKISAEVTS